ncbi:DUF86 domain-containing protein [Parashewanella curva]|uniref:DUF86 domain-containing protein n=1 Tax=Parashewanella curva TaxID=2338552 RepID=A0A3L8PXM0_9GAMM|nr:DUF86 domain-containing protein [Parashewanella curva]RLV60015.1 DUF86 domain-containing protein [Parashewanella curva]
MDNHYVLSMREHTQLIVSELRGLNSIIVERSLSRYEYRAAERTLQILIEACIGISKHWNKSLFGVSPADAYASFKRLEEKNIPEVVNVNWRAIVGMRNALVHDYLNIDQQTVEHIIKHENYIDLKAFADAGLDYLSKNK